MDSNSKFDAVMGGLIVSNSIWGVLLKDLYPILSFIAVLCGAILGLHGVYCLIFKRNYNEQNYFRLPPGSSDGG